MEREGKKQRGKVRSSSALTEIGGCTSEIEDPGEEQGGNAKVVGAVRNGVAHAGVRRKNRNIERARGHRLTLSYLNFPMHSWGCSFPEDRSRMTGNLPVVLTRSRQPWLRPLTATPDKVPHSPNPSYSSCTKGIQCWKIRAAFALHVYKTLYCVRQLYVCLLLY